jgi:hypothetical protein
MANDGDGVDGVVAAYLAFLEGNGPRPSLEELSMADQVEAEETIRLLEATRASMPRALAPSTTIPWRSGSGTQRSAHRGASIGNAARDDHRTARCGAGSTARRPGRKVRARPPTSTPLFSSSAWSGSCPDGAGPPAVGRPRPPTGPVTPRVVSGCATAMSCMGARRQIAHGRATG